MERIYECRPITSQNDGNAGYGYQRRLLASVAEPVDPRELQLIDPRAKLPLEMIRDLFLLSSDVPSLGKDSEEETR